MRIVACGRRPACQVILLPTRKARELIMPLRRTARPSGAMDACFSEELLGLGLSLINQAAATAGLKATVLHRDGLIIALLAPLRRRNLAGLRLRRNLVETNGSWLISLDVSETKTHAPLEILWPDALLGPLRTYLNVHRPELANEWTLGQTRRGRARGSPRTARR